MANTRRKRYVQPTLENTMLIQDVEAALDVHANTVRTMEARGDIPEGRRFPGLPYVRYWRADIAKVAARMADEAQARADRLRRAADELLPVDVD